MENGTSGSLKLAGSVLLVIAGIAGLPADGVSCLGQGSGFQLSAAVVGRYDKIEFSLPINTPPENPFDPNLARVDARITLPSGRTLKVPGFWFQDYRLRQGPGTAGDGPPDEVLEPFGKPEWRIRFASGEIGLHRFRIDIRERETVVWTREGTFQVEPGRRNGYVRISPRNSGYLETDDGRPFFPIGQNLCMYEGKEGVAYFDRMLRKVKDGGANYVRLWQEYYVPREHQPPAGPGAAGFSGFPLETQLTGLGRYDLESAWRLDAVADLCERLGIYWQLTSEMVVWWQTRQPHRWKRNPYNAENGGPCVKPADYLVDPGARELVKRRLRYNVARWGWTEQLAAWELWNEVDNLEGFSSSANVSWHREMANYLKEIDPWQHLVTTSWRDPEMFSLPQIDIVQGHSYFPPEVDAARYSILDSEYLMKKFGKPFFFGEQGIEGPVSVDPEGHHFHDCLWATALSGSAGTGLYWWWHNYLDDYDLYRHYRALSRFVAGIDWPSRKWSEVRLSRPTLPVSIDVYGLVASDRALVWVNDPLAFRIAEGKPLRGPAQPACSFNIVGLEDGVYRIEWWDTISGDVLRVDEGDVRSSRHFGYGLELKPPEFWGDIAARVVRKEERW